MAPSADALDRFVQLPENRAAYRAVEQLASTITRGIDSPLLFVHGPPGSGKSHLAGGLVERVIRADPGITAQTVAAAEFGRSLLQPGLERRALVRDSVACDLLVVEDAQLLPPAAGDELAAVLDRRLARRKAVVVTSGRSAADLNCSARLAGRLAGGLAVAMQPLARASRLELAAALCRERKLRVADEILAWLARDPGGARPMLGDIVRLSQLAKLHRPPLTLPVVTKELPALAQAESPMARVVELVSSRFGVRPKTLVGPSRVANVVHARHLAMFLGRQLGLTLVEVGRFLGGRDHTTIMHGCGKIESAVAADPRLAQQVRDLRAELL